MKQLLAAVFTSIFFVHASTECRATDPPDSASRGEVVFLEFTRRAIQIFRRSFVVGTISVDDEGFRFIPAMVSPNGFVSQERFEREFWYNPLFKELYIPFGNLRSIKHNGRIITRDKRMYMMRSHDHVYWHKVYGQIKRAIPSDEGKKENVNDKFIEVLKFPKNVTHLELYRRSSMHFMHKTTAIGKVKLEAEGLRFIPMTQVPPGYTRQEIFDRVYWYNSLMRELYIPFSEIESVRRMMYFRTKDGHKYILFGRPKYWESTVQEIEKNISGNQN